MSSLVCDVTVVQAFTNELRARQNVLPVGSVTIVAVVFNVDDFAAAQVAMRRGPLAKRTLSIITCGLSPTENSVDAAAPIILSLHLIKNNPLPSLLNVKGLSSS